MFIKNKKEKGITLIALVVTIIVLLILAGISIAMLTGEGGILQNAREANDKTGRANAIEMAQLDVLDAKASNQGKLGEEEFKGILARYFDFDTNTDLSELTLTTKDGKYNDIKASEIYNGEFAAKEKKLAKEVLTINPDGDQDYEKSPYVKYGEDIFRVLYSDEEHGVQLIPLNTDIEVWLGFTCNLVEPFDFGFEDASEETKKGAASYQYAKRILRDAARTCLEGKEVFKDARCLGSEPKIVGGMFDESDTVETVDNINSCPRVFKKGDTSYEADVAELNITQIQPGGEVWLASRYVKRNSASDCRFCVPFLSEGGVNEDKADLLWYYFRSSTYQDEWSSQSSYKRKLLPIYLLDEETYIARRRWDNRR